MRRYDDLRPRRTCCDPGPANTMCTRAWGHEGLHHNLFFRWDPAGEFEPNWVMLAWLAVGVTFAVAVSVHIWAGV